MSLASNDYHINNLYGTTLWIDNNQGVSMNAADAAFSSIQSIAGGTGADWLTGNDLDNYIWGGAGNAADTLSGGQGSDTYIWGRGSGNDVISASEWNGNDTVYLANITSSNELTFSQSGNDLICGLTDSSDHLTLENWYSSRESDRLTHGYFDTANGNSRTNWGIVVGVDAVEPFLPGVATDVAHYETFLATSTAWGASNTTVLFNQTATASAILNSIQNTTTRASTGDNIFFVFSGHGETNTGQLCPIDADYNRISPAALYSQMQPLSAKIGPTGHITAVFDSCYAGNFTNYFAAVNAGAQYTLIGASRANETSSDEGAALGGAFSYAFFVEGLYWRHGDLNQDGIITAREDYQYTCNLLSAYNVTQVPCLYEPAATSWKLA